MTIVPMCDVYVQEVADIDYLLFPESNFSAESIKKGLGCDCFGWVYLEGEKVVGYVLVKKEEDIEDILRVAVLEDHRCKGFGRGLMEKVLMGCNQDKVILCVLKENKKAISLYQGLGFEIAGLVTENRYLMRFRQVASQKTPSQAP